MLTNLKGNGRLWIYVAVRKLTNDEERAVKQKLEEFFASWEAHGNQLTAGFEIIKGQAIVVAVDEDAAGATGCSIDKATGILQEIDQHYQLDFFNRLILPVIHEESLQRLSLEEAKAAFKEGVIQRDTLVLNTTVNQLSDLPNLTQPLEKNWIYPRLKRALETTQA